MAENPEVISEVFHALAHEGRRQMLSRLGSGQLTVGELAEPLDMSLAAASKHVQVLERAGLVHKTTEGRRHICRLSPEPLIAASAWLSAQQRFWNQRLDALQDLFKTAHAQATKKG